MQSFTSAEFVGQERRFRIHQHRSPAAHRNHDVTGFDTAVNDAKAVQTRRRCGNLADQFDGIRDVRGHVRGTMCECLIERLAVDPLHGDEDRVVFLPGGMDSDEVWMVGGAEDSNRAEQILCGGRILAQVDTLECHFAIKRSLPRSVHGAHFTASNAVEKLKAADALWFEVWRVRRFRGGGLHFGRGGLGDRRRPRCRHRLGTLGTTTTARTIELSRGVECVRQW